MRLKQEADEIWTQRDGTKIAVGDMAESHVRSTLRMILRKQRRRLERAITEMRLGECQVYLSEADAVFREEPVTYFKYYRGHWTTR